MHKYAFQLKIILWFGHVNLMQHFCFTAVFFFYLARPTLWDVEFANQLSVSINHQARNGLEEMIQWTKEGKLWKYPINNEDGDYYTTQELEFCLI